jgi:hypothetical protein
VKLSAGLRRPLISGAQRTRSLFQTGASSGPVCHGVRARDDLTFNQHPKHGGAELEFNLPDMPPTS